MLESGDYFVLGSINDALCDLLGAIWANIKKYNEIQGKVMNKRSRRMDPNPPSGILVKVDIFNKSTNYAGEW